MSKFKRVVNGDIEYSDGEYWMGEREVCSHCKEEREAEDKPFRMNEGRDSFGAYAGKYCDICWPKSGYRDATDPNAKFDPADCGEVMYEDEY